MLCYFVDIQLLTRYQTLHTDTHQTHTWPGTLAKKKYLHIIEIRYYKVQASQLFSVCIAFMCFFAQTKVTCDVNVLVVYGVLDGFS